VLTRAVQGSGLVGYRSPRLAALGVPHLFTTRLGGGGRELCVGRADDAVWQELRRAAGAEPRARVVAVRQVHGAQVLEVGAEPPPPEACADALVTAAAQALLLVYTADCVPVLLTAEGGARVAAIHAGWRGLVAGVIPAAVAALGGRPAAAAIGPCLGVERGEMGPEVIEQFEAAELGEAVVRRPGVRDRVDVRRAAQLQLRRAGFLEVDCSDRCTYEHAAEFHSHRRDVTHGQAPRAGRLGALIGVARGRGGDGA
jgi:YfiH family protein